jgi:hypothetical protein
LYFIIILGCGGGHIDDEDALEYSKRISLIVSGRRRVALDRSVLALPNSHDIADEGMGQ